MLSSGLFRPCMFSGGMFSGVLIRPDMFSSSLFRNVTCMLLGGPFRLYMF